MSFSDVVPLDHLVSVNEASDRGLRKNTWQIVGIFGSYVLLGIFAYHYMLGWDFIDSLYFIVITFSTVGYGDLDPKTDNEKLFTSFYLLVGLIAMTTFLSVHLSLVAEHNEALAAERSKRTAAMLQEEHSMSLLQAMRAVSQSISDAYSGAAGTLKRTFSTNSLFGGSQTSSQDGDGEAGRGGKADLVRRLQGEGEASGHSPGASDDEEPVIVEGPLVKVHGSGPMGVSTTSPVLTGAALAATTRKPPSKTGTVTAAKSEEVRESFTNSMRAEAAFGTSAAPGLNGSIKLNTAALESEPVRGFFGVSGGATGAADISVSAGNMDDGTGGGSSLSDVAFGTAGASCPKVRHIDTMKQIMMDQWDADLAVLKENAVFNVGVIGVIVVVGVVSMMHIEDWDSKLAFYWACQTVTTVGYGDIPPTSKAGRIFTILYIIIGCGYLAQAIADIVKFPMMRRARHLEEKVLKQFGGELSEAKLNLIFDCDMYQRNPHLCADPEGMTKMEFILLVLEMMNKVEEKDLLLVSKIFDRLDVNGDGSLNQEDMAMIRAAAKVRDEAQVLHEAQQKAQTERIRRQQIDEKDTLMGNMTGHLYDILSSIGLRDSTGTSPRKSGGGASFIRGSKMEEESEYSTSSAGSDALRVPLVEK